MVHQWSFRDSNGKYPNTISVIEVKYRVVRVLKNFKEEDMKTLRFGLAGFVLSSLVLLTACGGTTPSSGNTTATPTTPPTQAPTPTPTPLTHLQQGQAANVGATWKISVGDTFLLTSSRGEHFAVVTVGMTNISSTSQSEDPSQDWSLVDAKGNTYNQCSGTVSGQLSSGSVEPEVTVSGAICFAVQAGGRFTLAFSSGSLTASWDISVS
jgi:Domain of unknown function (DUF4352)